MSKKTRMNDPISFRLSEETRKQIEAEARITKTTASEVIRKRIERRIEVEQGLCEAISNFEMDLRQNMLRAVEMPDRQLMEHIDWMHGHHQRMHPEHRPEFEKEMAVFATERELRGL